MRLLSLFFFLLPISWVSAWPRSAAPSELSQAPHVSSHSNITCYEASVGSGSTKEITCEGACLLQVGVIEDHKMWSLSCRSTGWDKPVCSPMLGLHATGCFCFTSHCFTPAMGRAAMDEYYRTGEISIEFLNNYTEGTRKENTRVPGGESPNTDSKPQETPAGGNPNVYPTYNHGSAVFSTAFFLAFNAVVIFAS